MRQKPRDDASSAMPDRIALWQQLQCVADVVAQVRSGTSAQVALATAPVALRAGVQAIVFDVLRALGRAQALRTLLVPRPPAPAVDALLCAALALLSEPGEPRYDAFTLVNQSVESAKRSPRQRALATFINACLRRFLREKDALLQAIANDPVARWNHPLWWIERLKVDHPQHWQAMLQFNNMRAPMTLRVHARQSTPADYLAQLLALGMQASLRGAHGIALARPVPVTDLPGFAQGIVSVQDAAAQLAAPLLLGEPVRFDSRIPTASGHPEASGVRNASPLRVLDACAAPGGKTAHLLELADHQVTALEIDPVRAERLVQTLARVGVQAQLVVADAAQPERWWDGQLFDAILLDAPCTASGIVRRHPDVRWLRRESDIAQLAQLQAGLLRTMWGLLKPGGRLLYCTCSVFLAEGQRQVETFLAHNTGARLLPSPGHLLPDFSAKASAVPDNQMRDHDGFFYALLEKNTT